MEAARPAVKTWSVLEAVVSLLLMIHFLLTFGGCGGFPQLFEGWSRVDPSLCHSVQHLVVSEPGKVCSPTYGPMSLSNHSQGLCCPLLARLQSSNPKRSV